MSAVGLSTQICHTNSDCCAAFVCSLIGLCVAPHFGELYYDFLKAFVLETGMVTDSSVKIIEDVLSNTFGVKPTPRNFIPFPFYPPPHHARR